ncbi:MAG: hypothetical protein MPJ78_18855 [Hyphomicrobiaceae bacterium]|nr:hypothetical protein [Hyphomicrobiaceae bacterium]
MNRTTLILTGIFLVLLTFVFFDAAADLWPAIGVQADACAHAQSMTGEAKTEYTNAIKKAYKIACKTANTPVVRVNVEGMRMALSPDQALYGVVALFAGLGGALQSLRGLFFVEPGKDRGPTSIAWTLIRPFAAIALALIVYVCVRALFLPTGNLASTNPYGFLAMAALIGLFTDSILNRFRTVTQPFFGGGS